MLFPLDVMLSVINKLFLCFQLAMVPIIVRIVPLVKMFAALVRHLACLIPMENVLVSIDRTVIAIAISITRFCSVMCVLKIKYEQMLQ